MDGVHDKGLKWICGNKLLHNFPRKEENASHPIKQLGFAGQAYLGENDASGLTCMGLGGPAILWVDLPYVAILWVEVDCEACHIVGGCSRQAAIVAWTLNGSSVDNRKQATKKCSKSS